MGRLDNIQFRRDSAANWTAANPILRDGEPGFEIDTGKVKVGDGVTAWAFLSYISGGGTGADGADGPPGAPGFPGPEGPEAPAFFMPGPRGATGAAGANGAAGATGARGATGVPGFSGPEGDDGIFVPGARGATGAQGVQGDPGAQGLQGNPGDPGAPGADGARGPLGFPGSDGEDGFFVPGIRGLTGATGSQGPQGDPGTPGAPGADGADGARGPIGFTGPEGESTIFVPGPRGATGATGSQGPQGDPGSAGADGTPGVPGMPGADGEGSDFMAVPPRRIKASELLHNSLSGRAVSDAHDAAYISFPVGWYPNGGILGSAAQDVRTAFDELDTHSHDGVLQSGYYPDGQPVQYRNLGRKPQMWVPPAASDGEPGLFLPGPRGPQGPTGATGPQGDPGTSGSGGPAGPPAMYVEDGDPGMFVPGQKLTRWDSNWVELISTGDETVTNSSTLVSHTQLVVPLASEALYEVEFSIIISANNNIGDIKIAWTLANALDAGSDIFGEIWGELGTNAAGTISEYIGASTTIWPSSGGHAIGADSLSQNTPRLFWGRFMVFNNANAGATTASLQFANATPAGGRTSTIRAGSLVRYRRRA